jgi:hypothetical protein
MPRRIILVDEHNWASVGTKLARALGSHFDVRHIRLKHRHFPISKRKSIPASTSDEVREAFNAPKESLIIFIEPGSLSPRQKPFAHYLHPKIMGVARPDIPFGLFWCGTIYRLTNFFMKARLSPYYKRYLVKRRTWLNTRTPLRFCATEDLETIDIGSTFVGQPFGFPDTMPGKPERHRILHVPTSPKKTDFTKGTARIRTAFQSINKIMPAEVVAWGTANHTVIAKMKQSTMYVMTMTSWDSGTGYTGIEALANGCLVFSKKPTNTKIPTPIINVNNEADLIRQVKKYAGDRNLYEKKRKEQFEWAKLTFGFKQVGLAVKKDIARIIDKGWKR